MTEEVKNVDKESRTEQIHIRVTKTQKELLQLYAGRDGITVTTLVEHAIIAYITWLSRMEEMLNVRRAQKG